MGKICGLGGGGVGSPGCGSSGGECLGEGRVALKSSIWHSGHATISLTGSTTTFFFFFGFGLRCGGKGATGGL